MFALKPQHFLNDEVMVFKHLGGIQVCQRHPKRMTGVVSSLNLGQLLSRLQFNVESMSDGSASSRAVGIIEDLLRTN
jgi:hypothetical protein